MTDNGEFLCHSMLTLNKDGKFQPTTDRNYAEQMNCIFLPTDKNDKNATTNFAELVKRNNKQLVIETLHDFDPSIETLEALPDGLFLKVKDINELLPINMCGDGARRVVNIVSSIANEDYTMVLIYEFDNGLHYSAHKKIWKAVLCLVKKNAMCNYS